MTPFVCIRGLYVVLQLIVGTWNSLKVLSTNLTFLIILTLLYIIFLSFSSYHRSFLMKDSLHLTLDEFELQKI